MTLKPMVPPTFVMTPAASKLHDEQALARPGYDTPLDLTIFVSCYNESDYITRTLDTVRAALTQVGRLTYEIIVIDDVSKDGSAGIVEDYIRSHPDERIILQRNAFNRGLAQNYFDAAFIGKGRYYRLICGDDAEPLDTMIAVFGATGDADMVVPYYVSSEGRSRQRMLLSNAFTLLVNTISNHNLHYYNGLAVHLRHNVMRWHPNTRGFGFQADILCLMLDQGFSYKEVPVRTVERKVSGKSRALTFKNMLSVTHTLIDLMFRRLSNWVYQRR